MVARARPALLMLMLMLMLACVPGCGASVEDQGTRPNILWLVCEDQSPDFFPMYGDETVSLPNLERLAADGVVYDNAYAPVPVCAPARSSLITGMHATTLGTHNMRSYNTYSRANQPALGIGSYSPVVPEGVRCFTEALRAAGYYCTNNAKEDYNFAPPESAWDESSDQAHWRNRQGDQPFFAVFNFDITHESQVWWQADAKLFVDPADVPVPVFFPDDDVVRKDLAVNYSNLVRLDRQVGKVLDQLKADGLDDDTIVFFYSDHGGPFPRYKRSLYETGTKVALVVRSPDGSGHGTRDERLVSFIDFGPTVLSLAGLEPAPGMQGLPFMGKYAADTPREVLFTTSDRFDESIDRIRAVRSERFKYLKNFNPSQPYALPIAYRDNMPMMPHMRALYAANELTPEAARWFAPHKPAEELYDLESDPHELHDLANDPAYAAALEHLRGVLDRWIIETHDQGRSDERQLMDSWLVDGQQPRLPAPRFDRTGDSLAIHSDRADATLLWRRLRSAAWKIYTGPLAVSAKGRVFSKAVRIGFKSADSVFVVE